MPSTDFCPAVSAPLGTLSRFRDTRQISPALRRLEQRGWIDGEWGSSEDNRRARYYTLTRSGRAQLAKEKRDWYRMTSAMNWMLESEG